jgi:TonB family protein
MHATPERTATTSLRLPSAWRSHVVVVLILVSCHAAVFYGIAQTRAPRSNTDGPPMFGPVVSELGERRGLALPGRSVAPAAEDQSTPPPGHWIFPPIDIWPSVAGPPATLSEFTPVTDAQPDPPDTQTRPQDGLRANKPAPRRSKLRMVRWLRPEYPVERALAGVEGSVLLDLLIDPHGQPVESMVAQRSESPELDEAALRAANLWRFAPPLWKSRPVEVWARVEVRYNFFSFEFSRIGKPSADTSSDNSDRGNSAELVSNRDHAIRRLIEQLQSGLLQPTSDPPSADGLPPLTTAVREWGPVVGLKYMGVVGEPEWRTYIIKPAYRSDPRASAVTVRWELYRVEHQRRSSLWKVAFDRRGQAWAVKAEVVSPGDEP